MTMKLRAEKFRVRQGVSLAGGTAPAAARPEPDAGLFAGHEDGFGADPFPTARVGKPGPTPRAATGPRQTVEEEIAAIRAEGLTGRQLRMARRVAQKHGIEATSDYDAVRLLRGQGIDPFRHASMLELVVGAPDQDEDGTLPVEVPSNLPQTVPEPKLPSPIVSDEAARAKEIVRMQRDIVRRRRRRFVLMMVRLAAFVLLPTVVAGYYYFALATPMYATSSEFGIQKAEAQSASGLGSLFAGSAMATSQDAITVQGYLQSREAMMRLDADHGFKAHFSDDRIDPIQRIAADASNEDAYKVYKRHLKISFDPTEGVVKMEVSAADPETSAIFSRALIGYAEEQVDQLTQRVRGDQMQGARQSYEEAEANMRAAQTRVVELQEQRGVLSAEAEVSSLMGQIAQFETQLRTERLQLLELMANPRPNQTRVQVAEANIARLEELIAEMRAQMTASGDDSTSLARITGELMIAEADLQTRQVLLAQSLQQLETARIEANRQVRYLAVGVTPIPPDRPTYPRAFESTFVAALIFAGIYLMISLTASILREQVSA